MFREEEGNSDEPRQSLFGPGYGRILAQDFSCIECAAPEACEGFPLDRASPGGIAAFPGKVHLCGPRSVRRLRRPMSDDGKRCTRCGWICKVFGATGGQLGQNCVGRNARAKSSKNLFAE